MRLYRVFAICLFCAFVATAADTAGPSLADFEKSVTEFSLANGLKFIVVERHRVPTVAFNLYVDVGAVDEVTGITGISHLFEHMAFKGTHTIGTKNYLLEKAALEKLDKAYLALEAERLKGRRADAAKVKALDEEFQKAQEQADKHVVNNQFSQIIERSGGVNLNAGTSYDSTVYNFEWPSNKLDLWFSMESYRFLDPVTRDFNKERDVVMEGPPLRVESQALGKQSGDVVRVAYKAHPYGQPVVGHRSEVTSLRRAEADRYFHDNYVPAAMTAVIVGDVNPKEVRRLADLYFARLPKRPHKDPVRTVEPQQEGERRVEVEAVSQPILVEGYHKPAVTDRDHAVLDAITDILGSGRTCWLYKSLVREKKISVQTGAITDLPGKKYPGLFVFYSVTSPGHTAAESEKAIDEQIDRLKKEKISDDLLQQVKTRARAGVVRGLRSNAGLAAALAENQAIEGDWRQIFRDIDEIGKVTAADIQRVANQYFQKRNRTVGVIVPVAAPKGGD